MGERDRPSVNSLWVVAKGEYSDYRVLAAFDSKRRAEEAAAMLNGDPESGSYGRGRGGVAAVLRPLA